MRRFPILRGHGIGRQALHVRGCPPDVPWAFVDPYEAQAKLNHDQTLERLAQRGGLSPSELLAVLRGQPLRAVFATSDADAVAPLLELLAQFDSEASLKSEGS